ncbi:MAG: hypothetical protein QGG50_03245 [Methanopyri archaeon]|nr:hypothetical protein [Methanopyri archaeon]
MMEPYPDPGGTASEGRGHGERFERIKHMTEHGRRTFFRAMARTTE